MTADEQLGLDVQIEVAATPEQVWEAISTGPGISAWFMPAEVEGDAITGTVESISPASGSVFSLLPPENATGNFTKVVQRVPVRIAIPAEELATGKLRAGLSVVVEADTRTAPKG